MTQRRITPEEVQVAVDKYGLTLITNTFTCVDNKCCPLTALCVSQHGHKNIDANMSIDFAKTEYGEDYPNGFWKGFDGWSNINRGVVCNLGYEDGKFCRERLLITV